MSRPWPGGSHVMISFHHRHTTSKKFYFTVEIRQCREAKVAELCGQEGGLAVGTENLTSFTCLEPQGLGEERSQRCLTRSRHGTVSSVGPLRRLSCDGPQARAGPHPGLPPSSLLSASQAQGDTRTASVPPVESLYPRLPGLKAKTIL